MKRANGDCKQRLLYKRDPKTRGVGGKGRFCYIVRRSREEKGGGSTNVYL